MNAVRATSVVLALGCALLAPPAVAELDCTVYVDTSAPWPATCTGSDARGTDAPMDFPPDCDIIIDPGAPGAGVRCRDLPTQCPINNPPAFYC